MATMLMLMTMLMNTSTVQCQLTAVSVPIITQHSNDQLVINSAFHISLVAKSYGMQVTLRSFVMVFL